MTGFESYDGTRKSSRHIQTEMRYNKIVEALTDEEMTTIRLSAVTGMSYQMLCRDIKVLVEQYRVMPTGRFINKAAVYTAGSTKQSAPKFWDSERNQSRDLDAMLKYWVDSGYPEPRSSKAAKQIIPMLMRYAFHCGETSVGQVVPQQTLNTLRTEMANTKRVLDAAAELLGQIVNTDMYWTQDEMARIGSIPSMDYETVNKWIADYAAHTNNASNPESSAGINATPQAESNDKEEVPLNPSRDSGSVVHSLDQVESTDLTALVKEGLI
jgi:hypothetical protein